MKYLDNYDIITYENSKEYVVMDSIIVENSNFVYLVNKNDQTDHVLAMVEKENDKLKVNEIDLSNDDNQEIIMKLLEEFGIDMYKVIKERSEE